MHNTLMLLAAIVTIYITSLLLGERKDRWFRRRIGQQPASEGRWQDHFRFGFPKTREGVLIVLLLFVAIALEAWIILRLIG
ncbi:MAG: hypothetical protein M5U01_42175 [Ardenticatenaceae bacterium]|nr:hypothetical protein [Ardenticatenaceae bacterium]HBY98847.1 hypothetical protein [Chloroflexota bacterium]